MVPSISFQTFLYRHLKLSLTLENLVCCCYTSYEMTDQFSASNEQLQQQLEYILLKPDYHCWWISKMQSGREEERYAIKFCFKLRKNTMRWKMDLLLWPRDQEIEFPVETYWLSQNQQGQTDQTHPQIFDNPFFDSTDMIYMHWVPTGQTVNKEYYVEVLREFRKRFRRQRLALFKSSQWHFHQDNAPVDDSIVVTDYLTKMGIKTVQFSISKQFHYQKTVPFRTIYLSSV